MSTTDWITEDFQRLVQEGQITRDPTRAEWEAIFLAARAAAERTPNATHLLDEFVRQHAPGLMIPLPPRFHAAPPPIPTPPPLVIVDKDKRTGRGLKIAGALAMAFGMVLCMAAGAGGGTLAGALGALLLLGGFGIFVAGRFMD